MCGIVGIVDTREQRGINRQLLERMNDRQHHRGPDEDGIHIEPGVGLGHKRLSIIDLSSGQQPLFNEDHTVVVVYNGEIYNFPELTDELKAKGHTFRTHCDTEVIVHAWEEWGEACVDRFRGMFAFAVWDRNKRSLFLARDRLGIKPLFYSILPDGHLVFASELKALYVHPGLQRNVNPRSVENYFSYGYIPEPDTIYEGTHKLSPGFSLHIRQGQAIPEPRQYWDIPFDTQLNLSDDDAGGELIDRLREAVKIRMIAEVPLGAFLSGGVDSSAVVAMMAGLSDKPVNTGSLSFGDPAFNEADFARQVADQYRTNHHEEQVDPDDFALLEKLSDLYDEPYADSSAIPTYRVCELARKNVTVALSGDGGDENLAGYRRYRWHMYEEKMRSFMPQAVRAPLFGFLGRVYPKADWAPKMLRAKATFESLSWNTIEGYFHSVSILGDPLRNKLFSDKFKRERQGYRAVEVLERHARNSPTDHVLSLVQYLDMKTYLAGDILTKVDRASMAHSLEVRVPLLDHKLVEWMSRLPPEQKLRGREGKYIFKHALGQYLPNDILYRPKMGFAVPLASWFRGPLRDHVKKTILGPVMKDSGIFNTRFLEQLVAQHQNSVRDNSAAIWSLLMFEAFMRNNGVS